jgi:hypothetical protein
VGDGESRWGKRVSDGKTDNLFFNLCEKVC